MWRPSSYGLQPAGDWHRVDKHKRGVASTKCTADASMPVEKPEVAGAWMFDATAATAAAASAAVQRLVTHCHSDLSRGSVLLHTQEHVGCKTRTPAAAAVVH